MLTADRAVILDALRLLVLPGNVVELRALKTKQKTISGYFNDMDACARAAASIQAEGVYITLNPVDPQLLARANNCVKPFVEHTAGDADIIRRTWLPIDFDPVRKAGISSTEQEHQATIDRAKTCRGWLKLQGWGSPVLADSGNGAHLLYRIDTPNTDRERDELRDCLLALSAQFSDPAVKVDPAVFNASRIWKLYGTVARKGDSIPERPHRLARLLEVPPCLKS